MGFAQQQHTQSGLADTAADGAGQFAFQQHSVIFQRSAIVAVGFSQLLIQCERIYTDTHGGDFQGVIHYGVVEQQVAVQLPVIIVGGSAVVGFAGEQFVTDLHDEYCFEFSADGMFSFLGSQIGIFVFQFLRSDEFYFAAQFCCDAGVFFLNHFQSVTDSQNDALYSKFQFLNISLFGSVFRTFGIYNRNFGNDYAYNLS